MITTDAKGRYQLIINPGPKRKRDSVQVTDADRAAANARACIEEWHEMKKLAQEDPFHA